MFCVRSAQRLPFSSPENHGTLPHPRVAVCAASSSAGSEHGCSLFPGRAHLLEPKGRRYWQLPCFALSVAVPPPLLSVMVYMKVTGSQLCAQAMQPAGPRRAGLDIGLSLSLLCFLLCSNLNPILEFFTTWQVIWWRNLKHEVSPASLHLANS